MLLQMTIFHYCLRLSIIPLCVCVCVCIHHIFFIHSSLDENESCFHFIVIVYNVAMNIGVSVSFKIIVSSFLHICPEVELINHKVALFLAFFKTSILFSIVAALIYILTNSVQELPFLHTLSSIFIICRLFDNGHSN